MIAAARARLVAELGTDPGPELVELERQILDHDDCLRSEAGRVRPRTSVTQLPLPAALQREGRFGFVGRRAELARLASCWEKIGGSGAGHLVKVVAGAGEGKSALAAEFARSCHARGADAFYARWDPMVDVGYHALLHSVNADGLPGGADDPVEQRQRLFDATADALRARAEAHRVLLVMDDLHWADPTSLALIGHIMSTTHLPLLVVATRREPTDHTTELDALIATLHRAQQLTRVDLPPLATEDIATLADAAYGNAGELVAEISAQSGGNAFYATELLSHIADGAPSRKEVPAGIRDVLRERVNQLGDPDRTIIEAAALAGDALELGIVANATGVDRAVVLDAAGHAEGLGLLCAHSDGGWRFSHDIARSAIAENLDRAHAIDLHSRLAQALTGHEGAATRAAEIAQHLWHARVFAPDEARRWAAIAGNKAMDLAAFEQAERWFDRSLELARSDSERLEPMLALGEARAGRGDPTRYQPDFRAAYELAERLDDPVAAARAALGYSRQFRLQLDALGESMLRERSNRLLPDQAQLRLRLEIALVAGTEMNPAVDRKRTDRAKTRLIEGARELGDPSLLFDAIMLSQSNDTTTPIRELLARCDELDEIARAIGDRVRILQARLQRAKAMLLGADLDAMGATLRSLEEGDPGLLERQRRIRYRVTMLRTAAATAAGRFIEAREHMAEGRQLESDDSVQYPFQKAILAFAEGTSRYVTVPIPSGRLDGVALQLLASNALTAAEHDDPDTSAHWLIRCCDNAVELERYPIAVPSFCAVATRAAALVGPGPWVDVLHQHLERYARDFMVIGGLTALLGATAGYRGVLAHLAGRHDDAEALLHSAIARNHDHGIITYEAFAHYDLARLLANTSRKSEARTAAHDALGIAQTVGMKGLKTRTKNLLTALA